MNKFRDVPGRTYQRMRKGSAGKVVLLSACDDSRQAFEVKSGDGGLFTDVSATPLPRVELLKFVDLHRRL